MSATFTLPTFRKPTGLEIDEYAGANLLSRRDAADQLWQIEVERVSDGIADAVYDVDRPEPCCHGHFDCATVAGGDCADETLARLLKEVLPR